MKHYPLRHLPAIARSRGVGLVSAIFLLIIIAMLGLAIVSLSTNQQSSSGLDIQGARAYQAARAGIEWGLYQRLRNNMACAASPGTVTSFGFPATTTLATFKVTVTCVRVVTTGATSALDRYKLTAVACNQPAASGNACPNAGTNNDYVQRTVEAQL